MLGLNLLPNFFMSRGLGNSHSNSTFCKKPIINESIVNHINWGGNAPSGLSGQVSISQSSLGLDQNLRPMGLNQAQVYS